MWTWIAPRKRPALPCGYRVDDVQGAQQLFNAQGVLLQEEPRGPVAASALDWRAWQDAWETIEREVVNELRALRAGTRSIYELRRLRQYRRMLDAVAGAPHPQQAETRRNRFLTGFAVAVSAAVLTVAILTGPLVVSHSPIEPPKSRAERPVVRGQISPAETAPGRARVVGERPKGRTAPHPAVRTPQPVAKPFTVAYIVSLGEFSTQEAAEARMRLVRSKGHMVYVARIGDSFHVVSKPYRDREHAERLASALQEIGLPARAQVATSNLL
jgi:cell division septation protein DedD